MTSSIQYGYTITLLLSLAISAILATPALMGAQVQSQDTTTGPYKIGVKIVSPLANTTLPAGELTIHGISSDTTKTNCRVYVDWNDLKPMQNVTAKGPGGVNDYSNWIYTYAEKYHIITPGINELTSKITCYDNPSNITSKYYSVNITGLQNNTTPFTSPSSNNITYGFHNIAYLPQYYGFYHNISQPIVNGENLEHDSLNDNSPNYNNDGTDENSNGINHHHNSHQDNTNDDSTNNHDSHSQAISHVANDDNNGNSRGNDSNNHHSKSTIHNAKDNGNNEHKANHEKKHQDKGDQKHNEAHAKNLKVQKKRH